MRKCDFAVTLVVMACLAVALAGPADAALIGSPILVKDVGAWWPDVCYNAYSDQYLVFWGDYNVAPQVRARRVDPDTGALLGSEFAVSNWSDSYRTYMGDAVYNSINHEWFVVYTWCLPDQPEDIYGQRIDSSGNQVGSYIALCTDGSYQSQAAVTFDSTNNRYLVTWTDWLDMRKIRGRLFDQYGSPVGSQIQISDSSPNSKCESDCVYNPVSNEFLVVWTDDRNWDGEGNNNNSVDVYGQRINATTGALVGDNIMVCGPEGTPYVGDGMDSATVVCNTQNGRYFLAVTRLLAVGGWVAKGRILNSDGSAYTGLFDVSYPDNGTGAGAVYNPVEDSFVMSYLDAVLDTSAQRFSSDGMPLGPTFKVFSSNYECNFGGLAIRPSDGQMMQVTVWFEDKYTQVRSNILRAQRFDVSGLPPAPVANFTATPGVGQVSLTWTNPADTTFTGTMIRVKTTGYPTSSTDGTLVVDKSGTPGANDNYTHTGLTNEITYYYTAFAHNSVPTYSTGRNASAMPSVAPGLMIIPKPQEWTWKAGTGFLINSSTQIMANSSPDAKEINTATQLQRKVWDMTGYLPTIVYGGSTTSNVIAIGDPARCPAVSSIIATWSEASGKASKSEGQMIGVKDTSIVIRGFDNAGTFYGCQTLIQLLEYYGPNRIAPLFSYDYPELPWRGMYFVIKFDHDWRFTKELISEMFARYKMNRIFPAFWMQSISHPEIPLPSDPTPRPTHADAADFINFCKLHYITEIASWYPGNVTAGTLFDSLRENPSLPQDDPLEKLCQRNPGTVALKDELWHDSINLFGSQYINTGQSEYTTCDPGVPYDIGWSGCSYCSGYTNQWLFSDYLWKDRDTIYGGHGLTPFMWGDMLRPDGNGSPSMWNTAGAVDTMPSETIIADWEYGKYYNVPTDYPSLDIWISHGKKAVGVPYGIGYYPPLNQDKGDKENIYYWAKAVNDRRASYPSLMLGIVAFNHYTALSKAQILSSANYMELLECWPFVAEWSWNPEGRWWNPHPFDGQAVIKREISPDRVSGFTATPAGANVNLAWTNPPESTFSKTYIVYRTDRSPTSPIDGTYLADVSGSPSAAGSYTHTSAPSVVYYAAFAHDIVRHFSPEATAKISPYCFEDHFAYSNGALNGNGGWTGSATSSQIEILSQYVKINGGAGSYDALKTVNCGDPGTGYITVTVKINGEVGASTMWNLWIDDSSARNLARWYGSGTTARGRIGATSNVTATQTLTGGWDTLKVKIYPATNNSEFFFNGVSIGTLSHASEGAGDSVGRLRFERIDASVATGHYLYFDDLVIGEAAADTTPPGPVTNFTATPGDNQVSLSWTNPGDADFAGTMVRFKTTGYPTGPTDGAQVYSGAGTNTVHSGLTNGVTHYYAAYAFDGVPNYSTAAQASAVPVDTAPPGPVTSFTATAGDGQNSLSWTNPVGDFTGTKILFKTTGYPTSPTDGTSIYDSSGTSTTHTGLTNGVTYYYSAFAHDEVPNYASAANASATPVLGFCFRDQFSYPNGALNGNGGWTGSAGSSQIEQVNNFIRIWGGSGSYDAMKTVSCGDQGLGYIMVRVLIYKGAGDATMWSLWINDSAGKNLARWYGTGTIARGRIGSTSSVTPIQTLTGGWDSLVVKIVPSADTSQFFFNGTSIGTLSHASQGAGNAVGQLRFERMDNSGASGHFVYLDDLRVGGIQ